MFIRGVKTKIVSLVLGVFLLAAMIPGCSSAQSESAAAETGTQSSIAVEFDSEDLNSAYTASQASKIILGGDEITLQGDGATVQGDTVTIQSGGTYIISGTLNDGQIIVDSEDQETVRLVLKGAQITCLNSAPIYVKNAEKTIITLAEGTANTISDGDSYVLEDSSADEPDAAVFSKDDLTINGGGSLTVNANYNNGITSKDDLKITGGNIIVNSAGDGLKGKDCIAVKSGCIEINAENDGLKSTNDQDSEKGFIYIEGGTLEITAGNDGIQAETSVLVKDGDITICSGGGSSNGASQAGPPRPGLNENSDGNSGDNSTDSESSKGIKAGVNITIEDGSLVLDTADDALHSNDSIIVNGGTIDLASGDDGMHADTSLVINSGEINITESYEALESAAITINDGNIHAVASDDGINTAGGSDGSSVNGRPGQNNFDASDGSRLDINGGYIYINAQGDGIDVNGDCTMTDGVVIVNGPTNDGNGPLDYNGSFTIKGGFLVAAGSAGMAQAPDSSSSQASLKLNLGSLTAGTLVSIQNEQGENILTFAPAKDYASVVVSSPELQQGSTYTVYTGGTSTGVEKDGLYTGGTYSPGTRVTDITVSGTVSEYGQSGGSMMAGGAPGGPRPDNR